MRSVAHYIASNDKMTNEYWIGKDFEGSDRGLNWGTIPAFAWRVWGKPRNISADIRSLGRYLNPGPPEFEAGVLTARPPRSVSAEENTWT
jgi:hypothetical protein